MSDPKPLKRVKIDSIPKEERPNYIFNEEEGLAIKVPAKVLKALKKIWDLDAYESMFYYDLLAMIIHYRRLSNAHEHLKLWEQSSYRDYKYPPINVHSQIYKLLKHSPLSQILTESEFEALRVFICQCPEGYDFQHIKAHTEFGTIYT